MLRPHDVIMPIMSIVQQVRFQIECVTLSAEKMEAAHGNVKKNVMVRKRPLRNAKMDFTASQIHAMVFTSALTEFSSQMNTAQKNCYLVKKQINVNIQLM